ncbi:hypothetical protein [Paraburkholderia dilworthii]|uniref:hypothetical protein n=1 Tax=Paraburkholderia dilworthii TaxID=948106 RepID=UPI001268F026|nr:hypothetical protein [Paraburkholderia dilworthii]
MTNIYAAAQVTARGVALVTEIRQSHPVRSTELAPGEQRVRGEFTSKKMNMCIDCETMQQGMPRAFQAELDPLILEMWPFPWTIRGVRYRPPFGGKPSRVNVTPFLLCIESDAVYFNGLISAKKVLKDFENSCDQFALNGGTWTSPAVEEVLRPYGIGYRLTDTDLFSRDYLENAALLRNAYFHPIEEVNETARTDILDLLDAKGWASRREITMKLQISPDDLSILVAHQIVYFPMYEMKYADPLSTHVFRDRGSYECWKSLRDSQPQYLGVDANYHIQRGSRFLLDGQECEAISVRRDVDITFVDDKGECGTLVWAAYVELARQRKLITFAPAAPAGVGARREDQELAAFRLQVIRGEIEAKWPDTGTNPLRAGKPISQQTLFTWRAKADASKAKGLSPADGLVFEERNRGQRGHRLSEPVLEVIAQTYDDFMKRRGVQPTTRQFASEVKIACELRNYSVPCRRTLTNWLKGEDRCYLARIQKGPFARYESTGFVPREHRSRVIDTTVPFMLVHTDHTPVPMKLLSAYTHQTYERQLWFSALVDIATDWELSWILSYDHPTSVTTMLLLLLCAHRWYGHLPVFLATDNGADYAGNHVARLVSETEMHHVYRPKNMPRFGCFAEISNNSLAQNLRSVAGNTVAVEDFHRVSDGFRAKDAAQFTLPELSAHLTGYFDLKGGDPGPRTMGVPRKEFINQRFGELGESYSPMVTVNDDLIVRCLPEASHGGMRKVRQEGYVEVDGLAYYGMGEGVGKFADQYVYVKPDVFCAGRVWIAPPGSRWYECRNSWYETLRFFTKHEAGEVLAYLRHANMLKGNDPVANGATFQRFALSRRLPEDLEKARRCTRESLYTVEAAIFHGGDPLQLPLTPTPRCDETASSAGTAKRTPVALKTLVLRS